MSTPLVDGIRFYLGTVQQFKNEIQFFKVMPTISLLAFFLLSNTDSG